MGARDVKGFIRFGGGDQSVMIKVEGQIPQGSKCTQESLRAEIVAALKKCGVKVTAFELTKTKSQP